MKTKEKIPLKEYLEKVTSKIREVEDIQKRQDDIEIRYFIEFIEKHGSGYLTVGDTAKDYTMKVRLLLICKERNYKIENISQGRHSDSYKISK